MYFKTVFKRLRYVVSTYQNLKCYSCGDKIVASCPFAHANEAAAQSQKKVLRSEKTKSAELRTGGRSSTVRLISKQKR